IVLAGAVAAGQLAKLAEPFATPSVRNTATIVAKPDALQLQAPVGFTVTLYADNLQAPRTMMHAPNGDLFVAQSRAGSVVIIRDKYKDGDTQAQGTPEKLVDFPTGGHSTRTIVFSRDGKKMYVAVGSMSNKSDGEDPVRAAINEYNPDGTGHRIFASGLRNP